MPTFQPYSNDEPSRSEQIAAPDLHHEEQWKLWAHGHPSQGLDHPWQFMFTVKQLYFTGINFREIVTLGCFTGT